MLKAAGWPDADGTVILVGHRPGLNRLAALLMVLVTMSFWTSFLVRTYAWMILLGRNGVVNQSLMGLGLTDQPLVLLYNTTGVLIGMVHVLLPFMVLSLQSVIEGIDRAVEEAAPKAPKEPTQEEEQFVTHASRAAHSTPLPPCAAGTPMRKTFSVPSPTKSANSSSGRSNSSTGSSSIRRWCTPAPTSSRTGTTTSPAPRSTSST